MNDIAKVHVTFQCSHCGSTNELTAAYLHEATVIHCSHCSASIAPIGLLSRKPTNDIRPDLAKAS